MFDHSVLIEESERNTKMRKVYRYVIYVTLDRGAGTKVEEDMKIFVFLRMFPSS